MHAFETLIGLLFAAAMLSVLAGRIGVPYPALLALGGALAALSPWSPELTVPPDVALALFIAPVLLDAAYDSSLRDLRDNWVPITFLSLVAVGLTVVGVAWTAKSLAPELPWAAAIALGAIVAPPDAAAASAVLRTVKPPRRILTILQGESLFNDASSLLIYRLAVGAVGAGAFTLSDIAVPLALNTVGSVALGWLLSRLVGGLTRRIDDAPVAILFQFATTFGVWVLAERLGVSAIITIVVYAISLAQRTGARMSASIRTPSYAVWEAAVFALNAVAFLLVGLQIGPILDDLSGAERVEYGAVAFAVLVAAIVIRPGWVMTYNTAARIKNRLFGMHTRRPITAPTWRSGVVISWSGMRGIVSLAAAYALPEDFPARDLILVCTFAVVLGTLVLQGFTLGPLIRLLGLKDDGALDSEIRLARAETARAGLAALDGETSPEADSIRRQLNAKLEAAEAADEGDGRIETPHHHLHRRTVEAGRDRITALRADQSISDEAYHQLEEELDRSELAVTPVVR